MCGMQQALSCVKSALVRVTRDDLMLVDIYLSCNVLWRIGNVDERVRRRVGCACVWVCRKGGSGKRGLLYDVYIHIYIHTYTFCARASVCSDTPLQTRQALPFTNYIHAHTYVCLPFVNYTNTHTRMYVLISLCRPDTHSPLCTTHTYTHTHKTHTDTQSSALPMYL